MGATYKPNKLENENDCLTVDTKQLQKLLGCGRKMAVDTGVAAEARIQLGRRVFWNVKRIEKYLDSISE